MNRRIVLTGCAGVIGSRLGPRLESRGLEVVGLDLRGEGEAAGDICDLEALRSRAEGCDGIVHLAAVSRVGRGERDPDRCQATNVDGVANVIEVALSHEPPLWVVFSSSREVYGQPDTMPVTEDFPRQPINVYGRSKAEGERLFEEAARRGLQCSIFRLPNVYGSPQDHVDRVVPAFARGALLGRPLRVEGSENTFDFIYLDDVLAGIEAIVAHRCAREVPHPPIQFVSGVPVSLGALARRILELSGSQAEVEMVPPRGFDVSHFHGSPARAQALLGWAPQVPLDEGLRRLLRELRPQLEAEGEVLEP